MLRILVNGANGKMGKAVCNLIHQKKDMEVVAMVDKNYDIEEDKSFKSILHVTKDFEAIIDFSIPEGAIESVSYALKNNKAVVISTTGLSNEQLDYVYQASKSIPIFMSKNMSFGANLLVDLATKAAKLLNEESDIEIIEKHHNQKIDAPSGTAIMISDSIKQALGDEKYNMYDRTLSRNQRDKKEIGIHSVRGGTIVGEHEVIFACNDEVFTISHSAMSRNIFAEGAIKAAKFIVSKNNGIYSMKDLM
ncbi:MAG: 4-hydroxy-tetrahydrodipicolinate reductase [Clostridia bacterium]|nr:4-hydroxy-tetrahydrodipicolinate reductase [Clostridia bacterium]MDD4375607.1 4-hydroxy-tetrahydrodipicolinate reductase [Clostridia bacterium]